MKTQIKTQVFAKITNQLSPQNRLKNLVTNNFCIRCKQLKSYDKKLR